MAFGTREIATMILRLVAQTGVTVIRWDPGGGAMAQATVLRCIKVSRVHPGSRSAIVARRARAQDLGVINGSNGRPDICAMAIFADIGRLRVQRTLAGRVCSVMAADTVVNDIRVVEICRQPGDGSVAVIAIIAAGDMRRVFADGYHTVMTRAAGPNYLGVVDCKGRNPGVWCMAIFADDAGENMVGILVRCVRAVVAARTIACDVDVVKVCGQPANG